MVKHLIEIKILDNLWQKIQKTLLSPQRTIAFKNTKIIPETKKEKQSHLISKIIVHIKKLINQSLRLPSWKDTIQAKNKIYQTLPISQILNQGLQFIILQNWVHKYLSKMNIKQLKNLQTNNFWKASFMEVQQLRK